MGGDAIFLMSDGEPVEMRSELFDQEDELQELISRHPQLLAGGQMTPGQPRRWMLVRREMGVPSRLGGADQWSADHLFLDQDAIPTIIEVKRSTNTDLRRKVVGQMLDYAANGVVYWPVENLRATHETACEREGRDPGTELRALLGDNTPADSFWARVGEHLAAGRVRMVFVADVIPPELQRIVEFLNEGLVRAQAYAVELPQYVAGNGQKAFAPRLVGATAAARQGPGRDQASPGVDVLLAEAPEHVRVVESGLRAWAERWGLGVRDTSTGRVFHDHDASLVTLWPRWSQIELYLDPIRNGGHPERADEILAELALLRPSKRPAKRMPNLPTANLALKWGEVVSVLDEYADAS